MERESKSRHNPASLTSTGMPLRILWVEDIIDDVQLASREITKAGLKFTSLRVETQEAFSEALNTFSPDLIISDHGLPTFDSREAFKLFKAHGSTIPFILLTGNVSEEFAVNSLKLGIDDYILKSDMGQLPAAIINAFHRRQLEMARQQREVDIQRQNQRLEEEVRVRTQEVVREKNLTDAIIRNMPGICYVLEDGRLFRWNEDLETITGYSANEIRELDIIDLFTDREMAEHEHKESIAKGSSRYELNVVTKVGQRIPYYFSSLVTEIGNSQLLVVTGVDISDLKNTQETLRLHDERMELAFSTSGNAWWDWDIVTGNVESHPNRYLTLGYSFEDITPRQEWWSSLLHPEDLEMAKQEAINCLMGKKELYDIECRLRPKQGDWKWFHIVGKIVTTDNQGRALRMIGTADNISRNKLIEKELLEAKYAAESANRTKGQFLANMSHEIRTPLNAVIGLSHLAMKTELTEKQLDYLMKIHSSSESLLGIINDILDFSKIEAGKLTLIEESFDLEEIFQKLANVITYRANTKGLEIAFGISRDVPTYLLGDPARLEQVLVNLCTNAVKFTDEGEVVVCVSVVRKGKSTLMLQFEVSDTGIGMDEVQLSKLFQPFTQANDTISRKYGGTGLGLSIIKRLVEMMHGEVWVESELGKGSRFYFTAEFKNQQHQVRVPVPRIDLRNHRVLLVDDNQAAREILKSVLESFTLEVITVTSGIQAIHYLKNNYFTPIDIVLMDYSMPEMDGIEAARIIRTDHQLASLRIVMMSTGYASEVLYQEIETLNLQGLIIKPIRNSKLHDLLMQVLKTGKIKRVVESNTPGKAPAVNVQGINVLLVEDNEINQQVARELLEGFGFTVEIASNGLDAIKRVQESGSPSKYNIVLMDLQMPIMNGRAATAEIRRMAAYAALPIIALSADAMTSVREECLEIGMSDFITKPINPYTMLETIKKWLPTDRANASLTDHVHTVPDVVEAEGIDVKVGLSHVGGNRVLYFDLLAQFQRNNKDFDNNIDEQLKSDPEKARRTIHTMKGLAGSLGMLKLQVLCTALEIAYQNNEDLSSLLPALKREFTLVTDSIEKNMKSATEFVPAADPVRVIPSLLELEGLLASNNPDAVKLINKLGTITGYEAQIEELKTAIVNYNFDLSLKLLTMLRGTIERSVEINSNSRP
jgi:two-component system sensor histidine kinase/response regulator